MKLTTILASLMLVTSCAGSGVITTERTACAGWQPIRLAETSIDGLTDEDASAVLAHNRFGRTLKCW